MAMLTPVAGAGAAAGVVPMASLYALGSSSLLLAFSRTEASAGLSLSSPSLSLSVAASPPPVAAVPSLPLIYCGRGDKKTAKGKRFRHSYGNSRPRNRNKGRGLPITPLPPSPPRKDRFDDEEIVELETDESLSSEAD